MSFKQIRGCDNQIQMLRSAWREGRLPLAYLFTGPEGIGKGFVAANFIKFINCFDRKDDDACDKCASCVKIGLRTHPDVHWLSGDRGGVCGDNAADSVKIEHIRELQRDISLRPYEAGIKVFIINDAHRLTLEAANAFLKILEEPPGNSLIILLTSKPQLLLPTIISRCQRIKFAALEKIFLEKLLNKECGLDNALSRYLAHYCEGRLGQALNLKDKDALVNKNRIIDYFMRSAHLEPQGRDSFAVDDDKDKVRESLDILVSWFRDIYFLKIGMPHAELINIDRKDDLINLMQRYSFTELEAIFNFISRAILYLGQNINKKLLLDNLEIALTPAH